MANERIIYSSAELREERKRIDMKALRKVTPKKEVESFDSETLYQIIGNEEEEKKMSNFFDLFNYLSFAGFDYYHYSQVGNKINKNESIIGSSSTLNVLINKDQLLKLRNVVSCFDDLEFISKKETGEKQEFSIWYKNSPSRIDLMPFTRTDDGIIIQVPYIARDCSETLNVDENVHNNIPYRALTDGSGNSQKEETLIMKKVLKR